MILVILARKNRFWRSTTSLQNPKKYLKNTFTSTKKKKNEEEEEVDEAEGTLALTALNELKIKH